MGALFERSFFANFCKKRLLRNCFDKYSRQSGVEFLCGKRGINLPVSRAALRAGHCEAARVFDRAEDSRSPTDGLVEEMERNPDSRAFSSTRKMGLTSRKATNFSGRLRKFLIDSSENFQIFFLGRA